MNRPRDGFTLIELLTVLAVISILASLLLPVTGLAVKRAHAVTCTSNLHQVGIAIQIYSQDYGDRYPPGAAPNRRLLYGAVQSGGPLLGSYFGDTGRQSHLAECPDVQGSLTSYGANPLAFPWGSKSALNVGAVQDPAHLVLLADAAQIDVRAPGYDPTQPGTWTPALNEVYGFVQLPFESG